MSVKKNALTAIKWSFAQQFSVQLINLCVQIVLARLLMPEMFGLLAMVIVLVSLGQVMTDGGMTSSLIRTKDPVDADYSTVFFTNIVASWIIYAAIYFMAPYVAMFYDQEVLTSVMRTLGLIIIIKALVAVQIAKLTKEMHFKVQMQLQIPASVASGAIGVYLAYAGYDVWSLVWLNVSQALLYTVLMWTCVGWKPKAIFDKEKFKYHFSFGYKLTISGILDTVYNDAYRIVIGKFFTPATVGYFNHAETMRLFPVKQISAVVSKVTYPVFSAIDGDAALKKAYRLTMRMLLVLIVPIMLALILVAEEGFRLVFGEKWLPAVPYFQILCLASIVRAPSAYNLNILKVKGESGLYLKLEICKKIAGALFLLIGLQYGVLGLVISLTAYSYLSFAINMHFSGRLIAYPLIEQIKDTSMYYCSGAFLFVAFWMLREYLLGYDLNDIMVVLVIGVSFASTYIIICVGLDKELRSLLRGLIEQRR